MRVIYWYTKENEFFYKGFKHWYRDTELGIPAHSWVYDPSMNTDSEGAMCGYFVRTWERKKFSDFPPEFKMHLLLMGVGV